MSNICWLKPPQASTFPKVNHNQRIDIHYGEHPTKQRYPTKQDLATKFVSASALLGFNMTYLWCGLICVWLQPSIAGCLQTWCRHV
jgi:hypothetical protein